MLKQKRDYSNILIVEGNDDRHSVIGLMRDHTDWPDERELWPVWVEIGNSVDQILAAGYLTTEIKASNAKTIGVMLDADLDADGPYRRIRQLCATLFPNLPERMPPAGLVVENDDEKRFGAWIMPDNTSQGDLETFLRYLVPDEQDLLWKQACDSVSAAVSTGAKCRDSHIAKANLYTWLAWQDPPGQSPGLALTRKILDPQSEYAGPFVTWFRELYRL